MTASGGTGGIGEDPDCTYGGLDAGTYDVTVKKEGFLPAKFTVTIEARGECHDVITQHVTITLRKM